MKLTLNNFGQNKKNGLVLIELVVALGIFISVVTIAMGALLVMYGTNKKTQTLKTVMNNLSLSVESLSREVIVGTDYHCGTVGGLSPRNCANGEDYITFCSSDKEQIFYRFEDNSIERYIEEDDGNETCGSGNPSNNDWEKITSPEVTITDMNFYVTGAEDIQTELQPRVLLTIEGEAGVLEGQKSEFSIQTSMSQRSPKIEI